MRLTSTRRLSLVGVLLGVVAVAGCGEPDGDGSGGATCSEEGSYEVRWEFAGTYDGSISVATTWLSSQAGSNIADPETAAHIDPAAGVLLEETLPGCTGVSMNITGLDGAGDTDMVQLSGATLNILVDGELAATYDYTGALGEGEIVPPSGALDYVIGQ